MVTASFIILAGMTAISLCITSIIGTITEESRRARLNS
jgi:hypothetical protein